MMNANKSLSTTLLLAGTFLVAFSSCSFAQEAEQQKIKAAPAMYNVKEMQMQHGRIANPTASANCGTSSGEIATMFMNAFKVDGLPVFSVLGAPPPKQGVARIDIYPDVVTLQPREKECVSWVSLTAQSKELLRIVPIDTPRNLITNYWSGGLMVGSGVSGHPAALNEAVQKLTAQFSRQYRLDQPPSLTPTESPKLIPQAAQ